MRIIRVIIIFLVGAVGVLAVFGFYGAASRLVAVEVIVVFAVITAVIVWVSMAKQSRVSKVDIFAEPLAFTAHQLRNPLTVIKGFADLIIDGTYGKMDEGVIDAASKIKLSADRALKTIDELLDFSLLESGRMAYKPEPVRLNDFLKDCLREYELAVKEKNLSLIFTPASDELIVNVDPAQLRHIFDNLLDNALKYTDKGKIEARTRLSPDGHYAILTVSDTGKGIPREILESIFNPFERDPRHARDTKGVGLGLAIVKKMVAINGGQVWAESDGVGQGSSFYIKLPIKISPSSANSL